MGASAVPEWLTPAFGALRPPPKLSLSAWADRKFYLSVESAAEPGPWTTLPYQREIMDAMTDPRVEKITFMKSARVGATKMMNALIAYHIDQDPCPIMMVQPTVEDAQGYSKEEIAPMLRDCEVLRDVVEEQKSRDSSSTILAKSFPGGGLYMLGANSGRGFRRVSRRVIIFDEVDAYPPSAGNEGDQIKLGTRRADHYHNRKIVAASTPLVAGSSRIDELFMEGDQRHYHVPCPKCGAKDILVFREREDGRGHVMKWPKDNPEAAYFQCSGKGCRIDHSQKRKMLDGGGWIADAPQKTPGKIHASFHIWAAYSVAANASWGQIAREFIDAAKGGAEKLKTFINTVLGEVWTEKGEAPSWERLYNRRMSYPIGTVPMDCGIRLLTCGVDVQRDRFVYEVVGWNLYKQSWSVDAGTLYGDTANDATWRLLDELIARTYPTAPGQSGGMSIAMTAVDSGDNTQTVYAWCAKQQMSRVIAVKGVGTAKSLLGAPSPVEITSRGKRRQRGYKVWPVGVNIAKGELYGWLGLERTEGEPDPVGYCNFPEYGEAYFLELTAEHLVPVVKKKSNRTVYEWQVMPGRENHGLDCRVYARAAASRKGLDRAKPPPQEGAKGKPATAKPSRRPKDPAQPREGRRTGKKGGWFKGGRGSILRKRR